VLDERREVACGARGGDGTGSQGWSVGRAWARARRELTSIDATRARSEARRRREREDARDDDDDDDDARASVEGRVPM
jgi:hypothetical protein